MLYSSSTIYFLKTTLKYLQIIFFLKKKYYHSSPVLVFEGTWVTLGALNDDVNINVAINNDIPQIMPNSQHI